MFCRDVAGYDGPHKLRFPDCCEWVFWLVPGLRSLERVVQQLGIGMQSIELIPPQFKWERNFAHQLTVHDLLVDLDGGRRVRLSGRSNSAEDCFPTPLLWVALVTVDDHDGRLRDGRTGSAADQGRALVWTEATADCAREVPVVPQFLNVRENHLVCVEIDRGPLKVAGFRDHPAAQREACCAMNVGWLQPRIEVAHF